MREIKFRGMTAHNQWVIGGYAKRDGKHYIIRDIDEPAIPVIPETVGEYTGLKIKGRDVFEDDLFRYENSTLQIVWNQDRLAWDYMRLEDGALMYQYYDFGLLEDSEYIGNIHENHELI